jgi:hypothetical protein
MRPISSASVDISISSPSRPYSKLSEGSCLNHFGTQVLRGGLSRLDAPPAQTASDPLGLAWNRLDRVLDEIVAEVKLIACPPTLLTVDCRLSTVDCRHDLFGPRTIA